HGVVWIAGWFVGTVAARVVIVALYAATGAVGAAILLHATLNVVAGSTPDYDEPVLLVLSGALMVVAAVVVARSVGRSRRK
ncbi:hypothetical protein, partial [Enterococcus faecalis]|uniref:hypothetical protein n=1 Tax=Enterococcus faecalis TaxID=1351 RepID=UPI003D6AB080